MKLKQQIDDFIVEEVSDIAISQTKEQFKIYMLEKKNLDTLYVVNYLCKKMKLGRNMFGIAGLKDKHALTKQYLTVSTKYTLKNLYEKNFKIQFLGYTKNPIGIGDLAGNKFRITVRDIKEAQLSTIKKRADFVSSYGVPNYFDSQRFGSAIHRRFIAKYIMQQNYEEAVKIFLTSYTKSESSKLKNEKRMLLKNWKNIKSLNIKIHRFANIIDEYKKTGSWLQVYKKIPYDLRELFVSAYQSYLWNECIKEVLRKIIGKNKIYSVKYNIGELLYFKDVSAEELRKIPNNFKMIASNMLCSEIEREIIDKILKEEGITLEVFDIKKQTGTFFKEYVRNVIIIPNHFEISSPLPDELNPKGKNKIYKIILSFELPKGSYATVITKAIFGN